MQLDIIIVNYNSGAHLINCLNSLHKNNGNGNIKDRRITVYDNGSSDQSLRLVRDSFPGVSYMGNHTNLGFARAVNRAAEKAKGEYILLLNPDVVVFPYTVESMLDFMTKTPRCGILGGEILSPQGYRQHTCRHFPDYINVAFGRRSLVRRILPNNALSRKYLYLDLDYERPQKVDFVEGSLMMIRKLALEQIGFFDEDFFLYLEDADLCYRMKKSGWETWWLPESYAIHYRGENFRTDNIHPAMYHSQGFYKFYIKHYKPTRLLKIALKFFLTLRLTYIISIEFIKKLFHDINSSPRS